MISEQVITLLSEPIIDTKTHLIACMKLTAPLLQSRCAAQTKLVLEKNRLRLPKDKEYTDFDRQIMLDAAIAELQAEYNLLKGLEEQLAQRIDILSALL